MHTKLLSAALLLVSAGTAWGAPSEEYLIKANQLFQQNCAVCHGADRGGYIAPGLTSDRLVQSEAALRGTIMTGIPDTLMPPFVGRLSDEEIRSIAHLIKTQAPPTRNGDWSRSAPAWKCWWTNPPSPTSRPTPSTRCTT